MCIIIYNVFVLTDVEGKFGDRMTIINAKWKELSDGVKEQYKQRAKELPKPKSLDELSADERKLMIKQVSKEIKDKVLFVWLCFTFEIIAVHYNISITRGMV